MAAIPIETGYQGNCKILTEEQHKTLVSLAHSLTTCAPEVKKEMLEILK